MAKGSFGELLKRERELREVSLNELTVKTRVPVRFLEALESEDWKKLPGGVFNRGFVRVIARYLGLSEEHFLSEYDLAHGQHAVIAPPTSPNPIPSPPKWVVAAGLLFILLVIAGLITGSVYGWRRYAAHRAAKRALAPSQQTPPQTSSPPPLPNLIAEASRIHYRARSRSRSLCFRQHPHSRGRRRSHPGRRNRPPRHRSPFLRRSPV